MSTGDLFDPPATGDATPRPAVSGRRILVGTSGYSFADWVGPFYPKGMRSGDFLVHYARHFDAVEVNSTYYRIPHPDVLGRMERKTPPGFRFVVKLNQAMTHERTLDPQLVRDFLAVLEPLKSAGKYDGLLAQFPWAFHRTAASESFLSSLRDRLAGEPLFVEFRHASWIASDTAAWLRERDLGYCAVDEPQLAGLVPPVTMVTAEDAYVRFHGRNAANWWASGRRAAGRPGSEAAPSSAPGGVPARAGAPAEGGSGSRPGSGDRYDYEYRREELQEWVKKVAELAQAARRTYLFFNNCHAGQAARSAKLMQELLRQQNLPA